MSLWRNAGRATRDGLVQEGLDETVEALAASRARAWIATPLLSMHVAEVLAEASAKGAAGDRRLLTNLSGTTVAMGLLSVAGVRLMLDEGFAVRSLVNLHGRVVVVDDWAIVGGGDFAAAGVEGGNVALGVELGGRRAEEAAEVLATWWASGLGVTTTALQDAEREAARAVSAGARPAGSGFGGRVAVSVGTAMRRHVEATGSLRTVGLWLKPLELPAEGRDAWWTRVSRLADPAALPDGRELVPPSYAVGDLVLVYAAGTFRCPAILRVTEPPHPLPSTAYDTGWSTRVEPVMGVEVDDAPSLKELGIPHEQIQQRPRLRLDTHQMDRARRALMAAQQDA